MPIASTTSSVGKITVDKEKTLPKYVYYSIQNSKLQKIISIAQSHIIKKDVIIFIQRHFGIYQNLIFDL